MSTGLLACLQHEKVDCPECLPGPYVPAVLRQPDRFESERDAYQRGFTAGQTAERKRIRELVEEKSEEYNISLDFLLSAIDHSA